MYRLALEEGEARVALEAGEGARVWAARCPRPHDPPDVLAERDDWRPDTGMWGEWGGTPAPRVPAPVLELGAFNPRAALQPPVPVPACVALVLHNRCVCVSYAGLISAAFLDLDSMKQNKA
ncbi:hypothetical protein evm_015054 [Chilo suppressalis]|nr:hypothetical protein evm_015054 [Chilo suppressalis]